MNTSFVGSRRVAPFVRVHKQDYINGPQGMQLHSCAFGNPDATHRVVCLHGGLQAKECFRYVYEGLAPHDCFVVGFDLPCHGLSGPDGRERFVPGPQLWVESIDAVLQHYGLQDGPVVFLGWSMAGLPIRNYLQSKPAATKLAGLILVAATLDLKSLFSLMARYSPEAWEITMRMMDMSLPVSEYYAALLPFVDKLWCVPPSLTQYYQTVGYTFLSALKSRWSMAALMSTQAPGDTAELLSRVTCPLLFIRGQEDALVSRAYFYQLVEMVPAAQRTVFEPAGIGHSPFLEAPDAFNAAVLEFLNGPVSRFSRSQESLMERASGNSRQR